MKATNCRVHLVKINIENSSVQCSCFILSFFFFSSLCLFVPSVHFNVSPTHEISVVSFSLLILVLHRPARIFILFNDLFDLSVWLEQFAFTCAWVLQGKMLILVVMLLQVEYARGNLKMFLHFEKREKMNEMIALQNPKIIIIKAKEKWEEEREYTGTERWKKNKTNNRNGNGFRRRQHTRRVEIMQSVSIKCV